MQLHYCYVTSCFICIREQSANSIQIQTYHCVESIVRMINYIIAITIFHSYIILRIIYIPTASTLIAKCGLDLLKDILPGEAFFGRGAQGPKVITTYDSAAERTAISLAVVYLTGLHLPCAADGMEVALG